VLVRRLEGSTALFAPWPALGHGSILEGNGSPERGPWPSPPEGLGWSQGPCAGATAATVIRNSDRSASEEGPARAHAGDPRLAIGTELQPTPPCLSRVEAGIVFPCDDSGGFVADVAVSRALPSDDP